MRMAGYVVATLSAESLVREIQETQRAEEGICWDTLGIVK